MERVSEYTVGAVARLSDISVRTLHHYDAIGLLVPSGRSDAGYRLYSATDMQRLQQVLFYRALDFSLDEIAEILADAQTGVGDHLRRQHRLLRERRARDRALLTAIEHELEARQMGISLTPEEQLEIFGTEKLADYAEEAQRRWGESDAWRESQRRTSAYAKDDWIEIRREADENVRAFADAMKAGEAPSGALAMDLAEAHRRHTSRWFYDCGHDRHRDLAALFVSDPRYMEKWDEVAPGFSRYVHDAILANADRSERQLG